MHYWTEQNYTLNILCVAWNQVGNPGLELKDLELTIFHELILPVQGIFKDGKFT